MNSSSPPNSEPEKSGLGFLRLASDATKAEQLDELLARYEYHAAKAERTLVEAYALDTASLDRHYPHLRKAHLPRREPDPHLNPAFTTVEGALLKAAAPKRPAPTPSVERSDARYQPQEPTYVSPFPRAALDKAAGRARARAEGAPQPWKDSK
ncbi:MULTISPECIES: hypothetical protein [unclassified Variovorax]|jgi:hypothetical protein|uniref:hypothetical protein n=1 Tax=unclassified Variovorax TaxID=663243 RepID=UPI000F7E180F|nr:MULTISPECIES: hypothetical protein [unclassified Variovorax]RSZ47734.1 hypothetical protein EJO70_03805 [Variovorax sp. 553]RSZ48139.1 hypothetical protein EJO71_00180 [Variovorax sp. 679]